MAAALLAGVAAGCYGPTAESPRRPAEYAIHVATDSVALPLNSVFTATSRLVPLDSTRPTTPPTVAWVSRSPATAEVDAMTGRILALTPGYVWVVATAPLALPDSLRVAVTVTFDTVAAGTYFSCGLTTAGVALCWGWNEHGELGDGGAGDRSVPAVLAGRPNFERLALNGSTACAQSASLSWCWGYNGAGQVGDGTITDRHAPVSITTDSAFATVFSGAGANLCALTEARTPYCWGWNVYGQLLDGSVVTRRSPRVLPAGRAFTVMAPGGGHICALDEAGAAWCWGRGERGQIGNGISTSVSLPTPVSGGRSFTLLVSGLGHTCGLDGAGAVYCWGDNGKGQLGAVSAPSSAVPTLAMSGTFTAVTTMGDHTCALATSGIAVCWGDRQSGLAAPGAPPAGRPARAADTLTFRSISTGFYHTCGITTDGTAVCWGRNLHGALGDGTQIDRSEPTPVLLQTQDSVVAAAPSSGGSGATGSP